MLALMTLGMDAITAFGSVATCMNNMGPGLGETAANFAAVSDAEKWICALAMLLGRLEIFNLAGVVYTGVVEGLTWAASRQGKNED